MARRQVQVESRPVGIVQALSFALVGAGLLVLADQVMVPMWPVPVSPQPAVALFIGALGGWRLGPLAVAFYIAGLIIGLPIMAEFRSPGLMNILSWPKVGFVYGLLLSAGIAATVVVWAEGRFIELFGGLVVADAVRMLVGAAWIAPFIGWENTFNLYVLPMPIAMVGGAFLAAIAAMIMWHLFPAIEPQSMRDRIERMASETMVTEFHDVPHKVLPNRMFSDDGGPAG